MAPRTGLVNDVEPVLFVACRGVNLMPTDADERLGGWCGEGVSGLSSAFGGAPCP